MNNNIINQHVSIREACKLTGMCAQTLRKLGDQQKIKCYKTHSGQRKFDKGSLIELVKSTNILSKIENNDDTSLIKDGGESGDIRIRKKSSCKKSSYKTLDIDPSVNDKEYIYYDSSVCRIENKIVEEFIRNNSSTIVINNIDNIIDISMEFKNIKIYISNSFCNENTKEYGILKKIIDKCGNQIIVI